jgi:hypothetical protein
MDEESSVGFLLPIPPNSPMEVTDMLWFNMIAVTLRPNQIQFVCNQNTPVYSAIAAIPIVTSAIFVPDSRLATMPRKHGGLSGREERSPLVMEIYWSNNKSDGLLLG